MRNYTSVTYHSAHDVLSVGVFMSFIAYSVDNILLSCISFMALLFVIW